MKNAYRVRTWTADIRTKPTDILTSFNKYISYSVIDHWKQMKKMEAALCWIFPKPLPRMLSFQYPKIKRKILTDQVEQCFHNQTRFLFENQNWRLENTFKLKENNNIVLHLMLNYNLNFRYKTIVSWIRRSENKRENTVLIKTEKRLRDRQRQS